MSFLPKGYEMPKDPSRYMKLEEGQNTFRVLSEAITGWEYWTEEDGNRKPMRVRDFDELPEKVRTATDKQEQAKHFWAFAVYNTTTKEIQVFEVTQRSIMKMLGALINDEENWGDPKKYNITITKKKTGSNPFDVEYSVMPLPPKPLDPGIVKLYEDMQVKLEALFAGKDPFAADAEAEDTAILDAAEKAGI